MVRFPEATKRMYKGVFVCKRCKIKRRADPARVLKKKVPCRRCGRTDLRPISKGK